MFDNIRFPYLNMQQLNLDWILSIVKNMAGDMEKIKQFLDEQHLDELIKTEILKMVEDGDLDSLLNMQFIPRKEQVDLYRQDAVAAAASYLYGEADTDCFAFRTPPTGTDIYRVLYNTNGKAWSSLMLKDLIYTDDFDYTDTNGGYNVFYSCCTSFVLLCTMCRNYANSVYKAAFDNPLMSVADMRNLCVESGSYIQKPYTLDCNRFFHSYDMFYNLEQSGCRGEIVYEKGSGFAASAVEQLESGDILFDSRSGNSYPYGIHHVMIYIKDLADFAAFEDVNNCKFRPVPFTDLLPNTGDYGYVVHCSYGINPDGSNNIQSNPRNAIRLECFDHFAAKYGQSYTWHKIYACKPYANPFNSSKAHRAMFMLTNDGNDMFFGYRLSNNMPTANKFSPSANKWTMGNVDISNNLNVGNDVVIDRDLIVNRKALIDSGTTINGDLKVQIGLDVHGMLEAGEIDVPAGAGNIHLVDGVNVDNYLNATQANIKGTEIGLDPNAHDNLDSLPGGVYYWKTSNVGNVDNLPTGVNKAGIILILRNNTVRQIQILFAYEVGTFVRAQFGSAAAWNSWAQIDA